MQCKAQSKRSGVGCKRAAVIGKKVCYMHGGASTGPKTSNGRKRIANAQFKHGWYSKASLDERKRLQAILSNAQQFLCSVSNL
jgi:hypothetical protein